jgi:hypothetical protein
MRNMSDPRFTFVEPCGVLDSVTGEIEYYETSTDAKAAMVELEENPPALSYEQSQKNMWEAIDHSNTVFLEEHELVDGRFVEKTIPMEDFVTSNEAFHNRRG